MKDKNQTVQQQKQAYHAVSLFYEVAGSVSFERMDPLKSKDEKLATKKDISKPANANWMPVYDGLFSEIKLRHYSPKTLKSYRSWIRQFCTIQELLGHSDVRTTMIYTRTIRGQTIKDAKSPLDL